MKMSCVLKKMILSAAKTVRVKVKGTDKHGLQGLGALLTVLSNYSNNKTIYLYDAQINNDLFQQALIDLGISLEELPNTQQYYNQEFGYNIGYKIIIKE